MLRGTSKNKFLEGGGRSLGRSVRSINSTIMASKSLSTSNLLFFTSFLFVLSCTIEAEELVTGYFPFADIKVFYQMFDRPGSSASKLVLFLHGAKFTSNSWVDLGTLSLLHRKGYRTVAVDMPGFGKTQNLPYIDNNMRAEFVKAALEFAAKGHNVTTSGAALVSPSMSGKWAIPFLDRYGTMLKGWVAVAPAGVSSWGGPWEYTHKRVSLLAVYGENDVMKAQADNLLKLFGTARKVLIQDASHACYMDQPDNFHNIVSDFIRRALDRFIEEPPPENDE